MVCNASRHSETLYPDFYNETRPPFLTPTCSYGQKQLRNKTIYHMHLLDQYGRAKCMVLEPKIAHPTLASRPDVIRLSFSSPSKASLRLYYL